MSRTTLRAAALACGTALLLTLTPACAKQTAVLTGPAPTAASHTQAPAPTTKSKSGLPVCQLSSLPPETTTTVDLIHRGGPFPYSRDGIVFGNFERRLPNQQRGYYHEYTVPTPGAKTRGTRRVITGGEPPTNPPEFYYTGDHYETFCQIGGA
ncbi:ribonuclease domain-containing protein [Mycolicibacterium sp. 141076]|uniref:ribonuclease domain-containing protein n=1 Tax=Mycolicibacterium sp. 141076 TaxID=3090599 RepID=UPI00299ED729|nr:ribonuclease domain-containing protein [Mycolicibacterium sp. 141076]MDX1878451.1 ribonuclease domain-containing protein [Mycolicibacterium sp. 141076]